MINTAEIIATTDLHSYIEDHGGYSGDKRLFCPFCQTAEPHAPALSVYEDSWYCYGCQRGGDVIAFVEMLKDVDFKRACEILGGSNDISAAELAQIEKERADRRLKEAERKLQEAQAILEQLRKDRPWERYYDQAGQRGQKLWELRGIRADWQSFWELGFCPTSPWESSTLSIPVRGDYDWTVTTVKHRLLQNDTAGGKYRSEPSGVPAAPFICVPEKDTGPLFLVEGEIKAMVTCLTIDSPNVQVAGMPSIQPGERVLETFANHEPIYFCPDPDAFDKPGDPVQKVAETLGRNRVRVIELPDKIDDLIIAGVMDKDRLRNAVKRAHKI